MGPKTFDWIDLNLRTPKVNYLADCFVKAIALLLRHCSQPKDFLSIRTKQRPSSPILVSPGFNSLDITWARIMLPWNQLAWLRFNLASLGSMIFLVSGLEKLVRSAFNAVSCKEIPSGRSWFEMPPTQVRKFCKALQEMFALYCHTVPWYQKSGKMNMWINHWSKLTLKYVTQKRSSSTDVSLTENVLKVSCLNPP